MNTKSILQSKTVWLQLIAFAAAFFPPVQAFLIANPVTSVAVLSSVNILVRFVSKGKITIFADGTDAEANKFGGLQATVFAITGATAAGLLGISLPSCSPAAVAALKQIPIAGRVVTAYGTASYSSKSGIDVEVVQPVPAVDAASGK